MSIGLELPSVTPLSDFDIIHGAQDELASLRLEVNADSLKSVTDLDRIPPLNIELFSKEGDELLQAGHKKEQAAENQLTVLDKIEEQHGNVTAE